MFTKLIKDQDMFGHQVQLNNGKDETQNSFIGGCCSVIVKIFICTLVGIKLGEMFQDNLNNISNFEEQMDKQDLEKYSLRDKGFYPITGINGDPAIVEKYLEVKYTVFDKRGMARAPLEKANISLHLCSDHDLVNIENTTDIDDWFKVNKES